MSSLNSTTGQQGCPFGYDKMNRPGAGTNGTDKVGGNGTNTPAQGKADQCGGGCPVGAVNDNKTQGGGNNGPAAGQANNNQTTDAQKQQNMGRLGQILNQFIEALRSAIERLTGKGTQPGGGGPQPGGTDPYGPGKPDPYGPGKPDPYGPGKPGPDGPGPDGPGGPGGPGPDGPDKPGQTDPDVDRNIDFSKLSPEERSKLGLNDRERAILHLYGRQVLSDGRQDGSIYQTVLGPDGSGDHWGNKVEVALVKELQAAERAGGATTDNGTALDREFFALFKKLTGEDLAARYAGRTIHNSDGKVDIINDIDAIQRLTGLTEDDQTALRIMGHDPLIDGKMNGSFLKYSIGNANSLDSDGKSGNNNIDRGTQKLLDQDIADDGTINGSSTIAATIAALDKIYGLA